MRVARIGKRAILVYATALAALSILCLTSSALVIIVSLVRAALR